MNRFIDTVPLALTPLTPIHVGCGQDFEPTNYVIDDGVLYHFEPARLSLTQADRALLVQSVNRKGDDAIRAVQRFFHERRDQCRQASRLAVPVAGAVAARYADRVGRVAQRDSGGRTVSNQLEIERTAHHPHTSMPYLPGSSLKGSMRTGWLNHLDQGPPIERDRMQKPTERTADVEADLLGGRFQSDPFRLVDVADASAPEIRSRIVFAVDRRKQPRSDRAGRPLEKDLSVCVETICESQFRGLRGEIRFEHLPASAPPGDVPAPDKRIGDFAVVARASNSFYLTRLSAELDLLRRLSADSWVERFGEMIASLRPALDGGRAMLLRVGRHSGAESVTLDRRRWIQIRGGKGQSHWASEATTIWLAAERASSPASMLPFGWLVAERADTRAPEPLERWCNDETERLAAAASAKTPHAIDRTTPDREQATGEIVWQKARLNYDARNKTLTATGPQNVQAYALAPRGEELLSGLPQELQQKVRANQFVQVVARVRGSVLVAVDPRS